MELLRTSLPHSAPWVQIESNMRVNDVLLALAAGFGSLSIMSWLIAEGADPRRVKCGDGNIMHIAVRFRTLSIVKWLGENGFLDLAMEFSDRGLSPLHQALQGAHVELVDYFLSKGVLTDDAQGRPWTFHALESHDNQMTQIVRKLGAQQAITQDLPNMLLGAPLKDLVDLMTSTDLWENGLWVLLHRDLAEAFRIFLYDVIRHGRVDVLGWLYTTEEANFDLVVRFLRDSHKLSSNWARELAAQYGVNEQAINTLLDEVESQRRLRAKCKDLQEKFCMMLVQGAPVEDIENICETQDMVMDCVIPACRSKVEAFRIDFGKKLLPWNPYPPLQCVAREGHVDLVEWLLNVKLGSNPEEGLHALVAACHMAKLNVVKWLVAWMKDRGLDLNRYVELDGGRTNAFRAIFFRLMYSRPEEKAMAWEVIEWFVPNADIDVNVSGGGRVLHEVASNGLSTCCPSEEFTLRLTKFLVQHGADCKAFDERNVSVVEQFAQCGCMETVRWLALEKGVSIQHLIPSCSFYILGKMKEEKKEVFEKTKRLQREQFESAGCVKGKGKGKGRGRSGSAGRCSADGG